MKPKYRGIEDVVNLDWGDETDIYDWIWEKASQGLFVEVIDRANGITTRYRPTKHYDIDVNDLVV